LIILSGSAMRFDFRPFAANTDLASCFQTYRFASRHRAAIRKHVLGHATTWVSAPHPRAGASASRAVRARRQTASRSRRALTSVTAKVYSAYYKGGRCPS
jgi:hypothetical protein